MFRAERLRERRLALGLRPEPVASAAGCSTASLRHYEIGRSSPTVDRLVRIADALDDDPREYFDDPSVAS